MTTETQLSIRPPWPDELGRTWKFLGQNTFSGRVFPRVALMGEPERIVAASALEINDANCARLHLFFRGRFCQPANVDVFLKDAEDTARLEGIQRMTLIVPEAAPWCPLLEAAGYSRERTDEWWMLAWSEWVKKRFGVAERLANSPKGSKDCTSTAPTAHDYADMHSIASEHGLANLERLGNDRILGPSPEVYSPELSRVVRWQGEVAGMLLVKRFGNRAFVHLRAVAKRHLAKSGIINAHLMAHFLQPEYKHVTQFIFSAQPTVEKETIAMAKRFGGQKIGSFCQFSKMHL